METFSPPYAPHVEGTSKSTKLRVTKVQYGDGYSQRTRDGINAADRTLDLSWKFLTRAEAKQISDFFESLGGDQAFLYTDPSDSIVRKWTCIEWKNGYEYGAKGSFSCTLEEVSDLS